jgi:hypothetical protein
MNVSINRAMSEAGRVDEKVHLLECRHRFIRTEERKRTVSHNFTVLVVDTHLRI